MMHCRGMLTAAVGLAASMFVVGCGGEDPIVRATPTPTPIVVISPTPTPYQGEPKPYCSPAPDPAKLARYNLGIRVDNGWKKVIDSTPFIRDQEYCNAANGLNWSICPVRMEGDDMRPACDGVASGMAPDTKRWGPYWLFEGKPCRPIQDSGNDYGCKNHPTNQFQVFVFGAGEIMACNVAGICSWLQIEAPEEP